MSRDALEPALIVLGYLPYYFARAHAVHNVADAYRNASWLVDLETRAGVYREHALQRLAISSTLMTHVLNLVYFYGHWPVIFAIGFWLFRRHRALYRVTRNAFAISGILALAVYTSFPVAPPRLIGGFVDTLHLTVPIAYEQSRVVNPYAALPSLHVGWNVLVALALCLALRGRGAVRWLPLLMPPVMALSTVATGNHFFLDCASGALVAVGSLALAMRLERLWPVLHLAAAPALPPAAAPAALGDDARSSSAGA